MRLSLQTALASSLLTTAGVCAGLLLAHTGPLSGRPHGVLLLVVLAAAGVVGLGLLAVTLTAARNAREAAEGHDEEANRIRERARKDISNTRAAQAQALKALEEAKERGRYFELVLKNLCEDNEDPILVVDEEGRLEVCNRASKDLRRLGDRLLVEGEKLDEISRDSPLASGVLDAVREAMRSSDSAVMVEGVQLRARRLMIGDRISVLVMASREGFSLQEMRQAVERYRQMCEASAELESQKAALESQNAELLATERFKNDFLARVSHDLKTPLVSIRGYTELLFSGGLGPIGDKQRRGLDTMLRNLDRLLAMIESLLELSNPHTKQKQHRLKSESFDLAQLTSDVLELFAPKADEVGVDLQLRQKGAMLLSNAFEPMNVQADRIKVHRILTNLLSNALKFTPMGGKIRVYLRDADLGEVANIESKLETAKAQEMRSTGQWPVSRSRGRWILLRVLDTGKGIPKEDLDKIFEPWMTARNKAGLGLGLAITDQYVRLHDGFIEVNSEEDAGTVFSIWLPIGELRSEMPAPPQSRPRPHITTSIKRGYILIVDDEPDIREFTVSVLESQGHLVRAVADADAMRVMVASAAPEAILLDYYLGGIESTEVLKDLKANPATRAIPVGLISARTDEKVREAALNAGAFGCLSKPFGLDDFADFVQRLLAQRSERPARPVTSPISRPLSYLSRRDPTS